MEVIDLAQDDTPSGAYWFYRADGDDWGDGDSSSSNGDGEGSGDLLNEVTWLDKQAGLVGNGGEANEGSGCRTC